VHSITFSADGTLVAATSTRNCGDTRVGIWNVASEELLFERLEDFEHMATGVAFSPDSTMVAAGTGCAFDVVGSASVKVWDIASGTLLFDLAMPSFVSDVAFSPDGSLLAAAVGDGIIRLWEAATGTLHSELKGHRGSVSSVAFSPDGTRLASGGTDARLWDVASGEQLYLFEGHVGEVLDVTFSADGRLIVTGGGSHTLVFWDTATGAALAVREVGVEDNFVYSVAFSADSTLLATCEHDQMLRLWGVQGQQQP
jgi:WD40 repeat protein